MNHTKLQLVMTRRRSARTVKASQSSSTAADPDALMVIAPFLECAALY